jgi:cytosine/uracil/thiamine/allantoin permease
MPFNIVASVLKDGNAAVYYKAQSWIAQLVFHTLLQIVKSASEIRMPALNLPTHALLVLLFLQFLAITFLSL